MEIRSAYPDVGVLVLSQYVELGLAMKLLADSAEGSGTCSRTASVTFPISSPPCAAWRLVVRLWTRRSCRRCCRGDGVTIRLPN